MCVPVNYKKATQNDPSLLVHDDKDHGGYHQRQDENIGEGMWLHVQKPNMDRAGVLRQHVVDNIGERGEVRGVAKPRQGRDKAHKIAC